MSRPLWSSHSRTIQEIGPTGVEKPYHHGSRRSKRLESVSEGDRVRHSDEVRDQDKLFVFMTLRGSNPVVLKSPGRVQIHVDCRLVTVNFTSEEKAKEVATFFEANSFPGTERTVQQSLEIIRGNASWLDCDIESIKEYW